MDSSAKKKWEPAVPFRPTDQLHTKTKYHKPFLPSYEKEEPNMSALMCMEYSRLWFKEKEAWEECVYELTDKRKQTKKVATRTSEVSTNPIKILQRSYVKRKPKKKRSPAEDFTMKRFKNIPGTMGQKIPPKQKVTRKNEELKEITQKEHNN